MPVPFALAAGAKLQFTIFVFGLLGFCLINSAVYVLNDLLDAEADRRHSKKKDRPVASGAVPTSIALTFCMALYVCGLAMCLATGRTGVMVIGLIYFGLNLCYSMKVKHIALLDVFLLSSGFVLRVYLGCFLVDVSPSNWLLLCSSSLALFLGFVKRRADLISEVKIEHRPSLQGYSQSFLDQLITICAGVALLSYALYTVNSDVLREGRQMASLPVAAYGIFNYLRLAYVNDAGDSPVDIVCKSSSMQFCSVAWVLVVIWSLN